MNRFPRVALLQFMSSIQPRSAIVSITTYDQPRYQHQMLAITYKVTMSSCRSLYLIARFLSTMLLTLCTGSEGESAANFSNLYQLIK